MTIVFLSRIVGNVKIAYSWENDARLLELGNSKLAWSFTCILLLHFD